MNDSIAKISGFGIVPVVKLNRKENALPLSQALCNAGLPCAEITFRTGAAADAIRLIRSAFPQMLVGAGTILTPEQVDEAVSAGASFIVSPGLNPRVVSRCLERGIPVIPGCMSPSEVERAVEAGLHTVKFFPAQAAGGVAMVRALSSVYAGVGFFPTGGITPENLGAYVREPSVIACGGSWMVKESLIDAGNFGEIERLTADAVCAVAQEREKKKKKENAGR